MAAQRSVAIALEGVSKRFGKAEAVRDVSLAIGEGEFFSLLGPSGCGKTTTLRMIAGFEVPDEGRVLLQGEDVTAVRPTAGRSTWSSSSTRSFRTCRSTTTSRSGSR